MEMDNNDKKVDFSDFIEKHKDLKHHWGTIIWDKEKVLKKHTGWLSPSDVSKFIKENKEKVVFGFEESFVVFENFIYSTEYEINSRILNFNDLDKVTIVTDKKPYGIYIEGEESRFGRIFGHSAYDLTPKLFEEFKNYIKPSFEEEEVVSTTSEVVDIGLLLRENIDSKFLTQSGTLEIISADNYMNVLKENQTKIIEVDRDYVQKFVKIGSYLKSSQKNIFNIFQRILNDEFTSNFLDLSQFIEGGEIVSKLAVVKFVNEKSGLGLKESKDLVDNNSELIGEKGGIDLDNPTGVSNYEPILLDLNEHIISYQSLVISSLKMIKSLNEDDMITFYEMYEVFDKLGIFDTQWQKSMLEKLGDLTSSLEEVTKSLNNVNKTIKDGLENISSNISDMSYDITSELDFISFKLDG